MKTATSILQLSPEMEQIRFDALRHCDEHGIDDPDALGRIMGAMAHQAFLKNIEPYTKAMADLMSMGVGAYRQHADGTIEHIPQPIPVEAQNAFYELIESERKRYSWLQAQRG
jgi:hypothetical protein